MQQRNGEKGDDDKCRRVGRQAVEVIGVEKETRIPDTGPVMMMMGPNDGVGGAKGERVIVVWILPWSHTHTK